MGGNKRTTYSLWFKPASFHVPKDPTEEDDDNNKIKLTLNRTPTFNKPKVQWTKKIKTSASTHLLTRSRKQKKITSIPDITDIPTRHCRNRFRTT